MQAAQGVASTPTGVYIDVHEQGARSNNVEMQNILRRLLKNGKTAEMRAVQGVASTPIGAYIDVRD